MGEVLQETTALYGDNVLYEGPIPTFTAQEDAYWFYLFNRWDKSGMVFGDTVINAVYDIFQYTEQSLNKTLSEMTPVEIYAATKVGLQYTKIDYRDTMKFTIGNDFDFDDIESELLIDEKTVFDGKNYIDTGIALFDEDRDFTLALDFMMASGNAVNATLVQCLDEDGNRGFKIDYYSSYNGPRLAWGTSYNHIAANNTREIIVIRHKKGDKHITLYNSKMGNMDISITQLDRSTETIGNSTLVFGAKKLANGKYDNFGMGTVYWSKLWYYDLGEEACKDLVSWAREDMEMEVCSFEKYYLSDGSYNKNTFSLLAKNTLSRTRRWDDSSNVGGWAAAELNTWLNTRLFRAFPVQIRRLLKQVQIKSSIGNYSLEISTSDCYIALPSITELVPTMTTEPYVSEGDGIPYMTSNTMRQRFNDECNAVDYWTRSPYRYAYSANTYVYNITSSGGYDYNSPYGARGIVILVSI
jgi:hypothetical protein